MPVIPVEQAFNEQNYLPDAVAGSIIEDTDGEDSLEIFYGDIDLSIGLYQLTINN